MTGLEAIEIIRDRLIEYKNKAEGTNIKCLISPQFAQVRTELKALEILKQNVKVSIDYGEEGKDISMALVFYIDNKKTIYVVDEAIKEQNPEHFKELELLKEVLE